MAGRSRAASSCVAATPRAVWSPRHPDAVAGGRGLAGELLLRDAVVRQAPGHRAAVRVARARGIGREDTS
jgi:hypothetical protein